MDTALDRLLGERATVIITHVQIIPGKGIADTLMGNLYLVKGRVFYDGSAAADGVELRCRAPWVVYPDIAEGATGKRTVRAGSPEGYVRKAFRSLASEAQEDKRRTIFNPPPLDSSLYN